MASPEELACDPQASGQQLYQLAIDRPDLRAAIAGNPAAYPGLLEWLGSLGDPDVDAALAARGSATAAGTAATAVVAGETADATPAMETDVEPDVPVTEGAGTEGTEADPEASTEAGNEAGNEGAGNEGTEGTGDEPAAGSAGDAASDVADDVADDAADDVADDVAPSTTPGAAEAAGIAGLTGLAAGAAAGAMSAPAEDSIPNIPPPTGAPLGETNAIPEGIPAPSPSPNIPPPVSSSTPPPTSPPPTSPPPTSPPTTPPIPVQPTRAAAAPTPPKKDSPGTTMKVLFAVITVVALVAVGAVLWLILGNGKDSTKADSATTSTAQSGEHKDGKETADKVKEGESPEAEAAAKQKAEREKAEAEKQKKEAEEKAAKEKEAGQQPNSLTSNDHVPATGNGTVQYPAPPNAVAASYFVMPSGNIGCTMTSSATVCTIYEYHFDVNNIGGCNNPRPLTVVLDANGPRLDCNVSSVAGGDGPPLLYNTSSAMGVYACQSTSDGLTCWNTVTGSSFALAKEGYLTGTSGEIAQNTFPWN